VRLYYYKSVHQVKVTNCNYTQKALAEIGSCNPSG
jgi:hypothetical protein